MLNLLVSKLSWTEKQLGFVSKMCLGNYRAENSQQLVQDMVIAFEAMRCKMALKLQMLHDHLDKFKDNKGFYAEKKIPRSLC